MLPRSGSRRRPRRRAATVLALLARPCACVAIAAPFAASLVAPGAAAAATVVQIRGGGDGHGIGMSQYGAEGFARHGASFQAILAHYYRGTGLGALTREPTVRVLLTDGAAAFAGASSVSGVALKPARTYSVRVLRSGQMAVVGPRGHEIARFRGAPLVVSGPVPLLAAGFGAVHGRLEIRPDGHGGLETVDAVDLEDYVRGVVSAEMPASWSPEALKAQSVAARTYAITTNAGAAVFDQWPDTRSQMYRGIAAETAATDAAVSATRSEVVVLGGRPVTTYFFNSSGGSTENIEAVWPGAAPASWLVAEPDPFDGAAGDPFHVWSRTLTGAEAAAGLGRYLSGDLAGIRVLRRGPGGRVVRARVIGTAGGHDLSGEQLRAALGLLTTRAAITTITARAVTPRAAAAVAPSAAGSAVSALAPLVRSMVASVTPELSGRVVPPRGGQILVEARSAGGWRFAGQFPLAPDGSFTAAPGRPGRYRVIAAGGLVGPSVALALADGARR